MNEGHVLVVSGTEVNNGNTAIKGLNIEDRDRREDSSPCT